MEYYIRFGLWPENERSGVGAAYRRSYGGPMFEQGVSVYAADWDEEKNRWAINDETAQLSFHPTLEVCLEDRDIYLVTGDELEEEGSDGEPLLRNLQIIKKLQVNNIYNQQSYDKEAILSNEESPINTHQILCIHKPPYEPPILKEIDGSLESIRDIVGHSFSWMSLDNDIFMFTKELPYQLKPNIMIILEPNIDPSLLAKAKKKLEKISITGSDGKSITAEEFLMPKPELIFGDVLFIKLRIPDNDETNFSSYSWPWCQDLQENYDDYGEVPQEMEYYSLTENDVRELSTKIGAWSLSKRKSLNESEILLPLGVTHFTMDTSSTTKVGAHAYEIDACESCGRIAQTANNLYIHSKRSDLLFFGLEEIIEGLPHLEWRDPFEGYTCGCS